MLPTLKKTLKLILSLTLLSQLFACAVMSKKQCLSADWYRVGYTVGADGERDVNSALSNREKVCAKFDVLLDRKKFIAGHQRGIEYFCDPYNAVQHGIDGRANVMREQVCPENDYPGFAENFAAGYKLYQLNQDLYNASSHVSNLQKRRSDLYRRLKSISERSSDPDTTDAQRKAYKQEYDSIQYRIREISYELGRSDQQLYDIRDRAENYHNYLESEFLDPLFEPDSGLP